MPYDDGAYALAFADTARSVNRQIVVRVDSLAAQQRFEQPVL